ncbi:arginine--tRNA ligase [Treponema sp.]
MQEITNSWREAVLAAVSQVAAKLGLELGADSSRLAAETPPNPELGDLGFPMFSFSKAFRKGPPQIAQDVVAILSADESLKKLGTAMAQGPYVNVFVSKEDVAKRTLSAALDASSSFGRPTSLSGKRIMVEFSSPNTNKPLHLGHLRNDALGESVSRILAACGAQVRKVCIINDRGIHICKSMLAYAEYGEGKTPESEGIKSDRFVGDWYVRFHQMTKDDPNAEERAQELLRKWENGDPETIALWKKMNGWAVAGMKSTYERTGVSFDKYYYESETYLRGKEEVLKGLSRGIFQKEEDGSVQIDLTSEGLDKKVLLRKDGTAIYMTQDIGTAIYRHEDWPFEKLIFVVGSEQQYHFKVLFRVLAKLGLDWASSLYHLSYGMVNLPEGKMKSREGTVVDADDLINTLKALALDEIREKEREVAVGDPEKIAEEVALGALHYYLLQVAASKDMLFNPKESLAFNGNTGPYLQYMGARVSSMLRKVEGTAAERGKISYDLLSSPAEWELVKCVASYNKEIENAAERMDPSVLTSYLYELSKTFSRFYHDCPILNADNPDLAATRLALSKAVLRILKESLALTCIPFMETM